MWTPFRFWMDKQVYAFFKNMCTYKMIIWHRLLLFTTLQNSKRIQFRVPMPVREMPLTILLQQSCTSPGQKRGWQKCKTDQIATGVFYLREPMKRKGRKREEWMTGEEDEEKRPEEIERIKGSNDSAVYDWKHRIYKIAQPTQKTPHEANYKLVLRILRAPVCIMQLARA